MMNTDHQSKPSRSAPATSGPSADMPPPSADQRAIDLVRPGPDQSAVISASVVGYARPAETPPSTRAPKRTTSDQANAASRLAGMESAMPRSSRSFRP